MIAGCFLWLAGWLCASWSTLYYQLLLSQGALIGIGAGLIWLPAAPILPQWYAPLIDAETPLIEDISGS